MNKTYRIINSDAETVYYEDVDTGDIIMLADELEFIPIVELQ